MAAASEGKEEGHRKPCRACMDFKTWSRLQNEKVNYLTYFIKLSTSLSINKQLFYYCVMFVIA